jgi:hypothetical protein
MADPLNQIQSFAIGEGSNVTDPTAWESIAARLTGFQSGIANSAYYNTVFRQTAFVATVLAQLVADQTGRDVMDDGNTTEFESQLMSALFIMLGQISSPLTPYWVSVISASVLTPPASPNLGDSYIVPSGATGAWAGYINYVAQWNGQQWTFTNFPVTSRVGVGDTFDVFKRVSTGWRSEFATPAEALAGTASALTVNPVSLISVLTALLPKTTASSYPPTGVPLGSTWFDTDLELTFRLITDGTQELWIQTTL